MLILSQLARKIIDDSEKMLGMISIFLNLPRLALWPRINLIFITLFGGRDISYIMF